MGRPWVTSWAPKKLSEVVTAADRVCFRSNSIFSGDTAPMSDPLVLDPPTAAGPLFGYPAPSPTATALPFSLLCSPTAGAPVLASVSLTVANTSRNTQDVGVGCTGADGGGAEQRLWLYRPAAGGVYEAEADCGLSGVQGVSGAFDAAGLCWVRGGTEADRHFMAWLGGAFDCSGLPDIAAPFPMPPCPSCNPTAPAAVRQWRGAAGAGAGRCPARLPHAPGGRQRRRWQLPVHLPTRHGRHGAAGQRPVRPLARHQLHRHAAAHVRRAPACADAPASFAATSRAGALTPGCRPPSPPAQRRGSGVGCKGPIPRDCGEWRTPSSQPVLCLYDQRACWQALHYRWLLFQSVATRRYFCRGHHCERLLQVTRNPATYALPSGRAWRVHLNIPPTSLLHLPALCSACAAQATRMYGYTLVSRQCLAAQQPLQLA